MPSESASGLRGPRQRQNRRRGIAAAVKLAEPVFPRAIAKADTKEKARPSTSQAALRLTGHPEPPTRPPARWPEHWEVAQRIFPGNPYNNGTKMIPLCLSLKLAEKTGAPLEGDRLRKVEDSLNQTPMSYLGMKSPRVALLRCDNTSWNSPTAAQPSRNRNFCTCRFQLSRRLVGR